MSRIPTILVWLILFLPQPGWVAEDDSASLNVQVEGIKGRRGEIGIGLFKTKRGFPTHLEFAYEAAWIPLRDIKETASHLFEGIPAGSYAVAVVHDYDFNRIIERGPTGFPRGGIGFSNDQKMEYSAPPFDKCRFPLSKGEVKKLVIKLEYQED